MFRIHLSSALLVACTALMMFAAVSFAGSDGMAPMGLPPMCKAGQVSTKERPCLLPDTQPCAQGQYPTIERPCIPPQYLEEWEKMKSGSDDSREESGDDQSKNPPPPPPSKNDSGAQSEQTGDDDEADFDRKPPAEATKKSITMRVLCDGSGDEADTLDCTFVKVLRGVNKKTRDFVNEELEGESLTLDVSQAKCFADSTDANAQPERVDCAALADIADNSAGAIRATFTGKMKLQGMTPSFQARKMMYLGKDFSF